MTVRRDAEKAVALIAFVQALPAQASPHMMTKCSRKQTQPSTTIEWQNWLVIVLMVALLCSICTHTAGAQIALLESERDVAAYLRQAWRLNRARRPPTPALPPRPWSCKIAPRVTIDSSGDREGPALIRGFVYRADSVATVAVTQPLVPNVRVEQTTISVIGAANGSFEFAVPAIAIGSGRNIAVIIGSSKHANSRAELRVVAGARIHIDAPLCTDTAIVRESWRSDHAEWGQSGHAAGPKSFLINAHADGVDEGSIVKRLNHFLVVLRRGRLYTIDTRLRTLRRVATVDAFAPGSNPAYAWFDELIVHGDRVIVMGVDFSGNTTTIGAFRLDERGDLRHEQTFALSGTASTASRSNVARLVHSKLVLYSQSDVPFDSARAANALPTLRERRARDSSHQANLAPLAQRVYRPVGAASGTPVEAIHTVTTCDLARAKFSCESTIIFASEGSANYVSSTAVYVSTSTWSSTANRSYADSISALLIRVPLDGQAATAVAVTGVAIDQRSFLEREKTLHMFLRGEGLGAQQWLTQQPGGSLALLSIPIEQLRVGLDPKPIHYRRLASMRPLEEVPHRFTRDALVYTSAGGSSPTDTMPTNLVVVPLRSRSWSSVGLDHDVDRIDAIGDDALAIGRDSAANLHLSGVRLRQTPVRIQHDIIEDREHVYARNRPLTYRPDENRTRTGVIALPITRADRTGRAFQNQVDAVRYLRNTGSAFKPLGELASHPISPYDDCVSSCADWYGQARPIFFDGRIFALLGYELVEGAMVGSKIVETRRLNFLPAPKPPR